MSAIWETLVYHNEQSLCSFERSMSEFNRAYGTVFGPFALQRLLVMNHFRLIVLPVRILQSDPHFTHQNNGQV